MNVKSTAPRFLLIILVFAIVAVSRPAARPLPSLQGRPLGTVTLISGPTPCRGQSCYQLDVSCPELAQSEQATLMVGDPVGLLSRGTIMFMTGGGGTSFWEQFGADAARVLGELRAAGFRTVQLRWARGWLIGAPGKLEGHVRLACKPATVAAWVYRMLHDQGPTTAFCATGNSGGSAQVSYMLSHYGLSQILSAAVPTGGPPMGRIDLGCIRDDPANRELWYVSGAAALIDQGFGITRNGPCLRSNRSFRQRFQEASVAFGNNDYVYPNTMVWFLFGELDESNAVEQGLTYYDRLVQEGTPLVRKDVVPGTPHAVPSTPQGANRVRDIMLSECRPR
jgi:hypothetical protein